MAGGQLNGIERPGKSFVTASAITYPGTLVTINSSGQVDLTATQSRPDGFAHMGGFSIGAAPGTFPPTAAAGAYVAVKGLVNGDTVQIPLAASNAAISVGDEVETAASGTVDKLSTTGYVVGIALTSHSQNDGNTAGTYVTVWINRRGPAPA